MRWWKKLGKKLYEWSEKRKARRDTLLIIGSIPPFHVASLPIIDYLYENHDNAQTILQNNSLAYKQDITQDPSEYKPVRKRRELSDAYKTFRKLARECIRDNQDKLEELDLKKFLEETMKEYNLNEEKAKLAKNYISRKIRDYTRSTNEKNKQNETKIKTKNKPLIVNSTPIQNQTNEKNSEPQKKMKIGNYSGMILGLGSLVSVAIFAINPVLGTAAVGAMGISACLSQYLHHKTSHHKDDPTALELAVYRNCLEKGLDPSKYLKRYNKSEHFRETLYRVAKRRGWTS